MTSPARTKPPGVLAFDPSLTCTGYAVLADNGSIDGRIVEAGRMTPEPKRGTLEQRCESLVEQAQALLVKARRHIRVELIVVEGPAEHIRTEHIRSNATLPNYGVAVGALRWGIRPGNYERVVLVPVTEWASRSAGCSEDPTGKLKLPRVGTVCALYGVSPKQLGPKSIAGNVADAILIARWGITRHILQGAHDAEPRLDPADDCVHDLGALAPRG